MEWLVATPPVVAILVAVKTRNVYWALGLAILLSESIMVGFNPLLGGLEGINRAVAVFASPGNTRVLLFCLLIGAVIAYMRDSGGVTAMVERLKSTGFVRSQRRAAFVPALTGCAIFIETNVSLFTAGILGRPLYDSYKLSRERLAYIIDSTSSPVSVLVLLNGWGAYALGLLEPYGFESPVATLAGTIPWNLYAIFTLFGVFFTVATGKVIGPMRRADSRIEAPSESVAEATRSMYMWLPFSVMVVSGLGFMWWTGQGNIMSGSGSQSILWAICLALAVAYVLLLVTKRFTAAELQARGFAGIGEMVAPVTVLFLSIALGDSLRALGTGAYLASLTEALVMPALLPALIFIIAALTAFMSGTSWGTYGIIIPIAMPLALAVGIPPSLMLAAVLGGGVAGDHCSPISDTTIIASLAAGCDHVEHVKTQLPYALIAAGFTIVGYLAAGFWLV
ncbi:Na+/H+ antiporter NhaC family protein [Halioxenophilus aromaticivorans]|uniref:Na+/H+ antiporter NhaC family protein n=1 Tax=Halioxenophilus aromaticivorans TaxID=1306992 RepID=A0AAV3U9I1_9ALTE